MNSEAMALFNEMGAAVAQPAKINLSKVPALLTRARALPAQHRGVAISMAKTLSVAAKWEQERRAALAVAPNVAICVCVDQLAVATETGLITISTPYNGQPWTLCDVICVATQGNVTASATAATTTIYSGQMRISSFKIAGIDFVNQTSAAFATNAPTSPGLSPALWGHDKQHVPENKFRPWAGYALRPEAQILMKVYHEGTAATPAASLNLTLLCRSSPCDQSFNGMYSSGKQAAVMARLGAHRMSINSIQ